MSKRDQVNGVLAQFCEVNGVAPLSMSEDGVAGIQLSDKREVFLLLDSDAERLFACVELRKLPGDPNLRLPLLELCMAMNFLQEGTGAATLALRSRGLFCQIELPIDGLTAEHLEQGLGLALQQAGILGEAIEQASATLASALAETA